MTKHIQKVGCFKVDETGDIYEYATMLGSSGVGQLTDMKVREITHGQSVHLSCLCNPVGPIAMHFQRHRITDKFARFWDNANNLLQHTKNCPRYHSEDVAEARARIIAASGVQRDKNDSGQDCVDIKVDIFGDGKEESIQERHVAGTLEQDAQVPETNTIANSSVRVRSSINHVKAKFGGFMREWYILGYKYATEIVKRNGRAVRCEDLRIHDLLFGMWRVMLDGRITISGKAISNYAFVPFQKMKWKYEKVDKSIVVGIVTWHEYGVEEDRLHVKGINDTWTISVPHEYVPKADMLGKLIAVRCVRTGHGSSVITHAPFVMQIAEPGAVWVDSSYEETMYQELRKRGFSIEKPLVESEEFFGYRPDFVIRKLWLPIVLEVYGFENSEQYEKRKENKRKVYRAAMDVGLLIYLEWNVTERTSWDKIVNELDVLARSTG